LGATPVKAAAGAPPLPILFFSAKREFVVCVNPADELSRVVFGSESESFIDLLVRYCVG